MNTKWNSEVVVELKACTVSSDTVFNLESPMLFFSSNTGQTIVHYI